MSSLTAFHSPTKPCASSVGTVCLRHTQSPVSARLSSIADRQGGFKRRHWIGETLCTLSTGRRLIGLLDYERELLLLQVVEALQNDTFPVGETIPDVWKIIAMIMGRHMKVS